MKKIIQSNIIPQESIIANHFDNIDYCDVFSTESYNKQSIETITEIIFNSPNWVDSLLNIRDSIAGLFGLKTSKSLSNTKKTEVNKPKLFTVTAQNDNEIVMGENDKHLNFRVSVIRKESESKRIISVITLVHYNNIWGKLYFFFVKPFHKIIVKSSVNKINSKFLSK